MRTPRDKHVIEHWLRLYNLLTGSSYNVKCWPDKDSSKPNIDALCVDESGLTLALEHTLIEPFENEKYDADRFEKTLAALENDPALCEQGYTCSVGQHLGAIPNGIKWDYVATVLRKELAVNLPKLSEGSSTISVQVGPSTLDLTALKVKISPDKMGNFLAFRRNPGTPGPELMRNALKRKLPKLAASNADKRILLLENDSIAGTIEDQYQPVRDEPEIKNLRGGIDEIWGVHTAVMESEHVIFTNPIDPQGHDNRSRCSLQIITGEFQTRSH